MQVTGEYSRCCSICGYRLRREANRRSRIFLYCCCGVHLHLWQSNNNNEKQPKQIKTNKNGSAAKNLLGIFTQKLTRRENDVEHHTVELEKIFPPTTLVAGLCFTLDKICPIASMWEDRKCRKQTENDGGSLHEVFK